jgi:hypothetical protein
VVYGTPDRSGNGSASQQIAGAIFVPQKELAKFSLLFEDRGNAIDSGYNFKWNNANNPVKEHTLLIYCANNPLNLTLATLSKIANETAYT